MKTQFIDGMPLTPQFMNAINNPTYSPNPQNDGELPLPPAFALGSAVPESQFVNSSLRGTSKDYNGTFDFIGGVSNFKAAAVGVVLSGSPRTDMSGLVLAHAAGDPARGFWTWNVGGPTPTPGKKIEFFLDVDYTLENNIYNKSSTPFEPYEVTFQLEVKNNSAEGSTAQISAFLKLAQEADLVSNAFVELLQDSGDLALNPGQSGFLWARFKVLKALTSEYSISTLPAFGFNVLTSGNFNINFLGLGIFRANTYGKKVPIPADRGRAELYSMVFREKNNRNIDPVVLTTAADWTPRANVTLGSTFKAELWPDKTIRLSGRIQYNYATPTSGIFCEIAGNPLQIPVIPNTESAVFMGNIAKYGELNPEYDLFMEYDAISNKTILRVGTVSGNNIFFTSFIAQNFTYIAS